MKEWHRWLICVLFLLAASVVIWLVVADIRVRNIELKAREDYRDEVRARLGALESRMTARESSSTQPTVQPSPFVYAEFDIDSLPLPWMEADSRSEFCMRKSFYVTAEARSRYAHSSN